MIDPKLLINMEQSGINDKIKVRFKDELAYKEFVCFLENNGVHTNYDFDKDSYLYVVNNGKALMHFTIENDKNVFVVELLWQIIRYLKDGNDV